MQPNPPPRSPSPATFAEKVYEIVSDPTLDDVISSNGDGSAFILWDPKELARRILPDRFCNWQFRRFIRELYFHGFKKISSERLEYKNEFFRRGHKESIGHVRRKRKAMEALELEISSSSGYDSKDLDEKIERLRQERAILTAEVDDLMHDFQPDDLADIDLILSDQSPGQNITTTGAADAAEASLEGGGKRASFEVPTPPAQARPAEIDAGRRRGE